MAQNLIESKPEVMMGKPVVAGTRITVELILEKLGAGETIEQILEAHPRLTREGILAALDFAARAPSSVAAPPNIPFDESTVSDVCRRWKIRELALFGSALREDFGPESDVDFLVTFEPAARWSLLDHAAMEEELAEIVGRKVDLVTRRAIERSKNWLRRRAILESAQLCYAAG
jgi:uncharacterized protein (DUF433 family)/predicted nucleotidyltransferase